MKTKLSETNTLWHHSSINRTKTGIDSATPRRTYHKRFL